jgi:hypothetical protein
MSEYPAGSTAKQYFDGDGNPSTLYWMVRNEPDWARSRIIEGEKAIERIAALDKVAEAAVEYVHDIPAHLQCEWCVSLIAALRAAGYLQENGNGK